MKKIFLPIILFCLLSIIFIPIIVQASECATTSTGEQTGLVKCGIQDTCPCELSDFFNILARIYDFIVHSIAIPLAVISFTIGGILMLISAGNPNLLGLGKKILYAGVIGFFLVYGSFLIIDFIVSTIADCEHYPSVPVCSWKVSPF